MKYIKAFFKVVGFLTLWFGIYFLFAFWAAFTSDEPITVDKAMALCYVQAAAFILGWIPSFIVFVASDPELQPYI